ncbi:MAG: amino acid ABC transporter ATP-binding protein [Lachnospirales bacterium]
MEDIIVVNDLHKYFMDLEVLKGVSFSLKKGEVLSAIGSSGSGKSTMLRCVIELERCNSGDIFAFNKVICKDGIYRPEKELREIRKDMGMVFQSYNLFPHMTVSENLKIPLNLLKEKKKQEIEELCKYNLNKVGLMDKYNEYPNKLSGGQKQRVAIARTLMLNPKVIFFDEPTSALDPELTREVLKVIRNLRDEKMTMIIVTHEMNFAREASDEVMFLHEGKILEKGSPNDIFQSSNERIRTFLDGE